VARLLDDAAIALHVLLAALLHLVEALGTGDGALWGRTGLDTHGCGRRAWYRTRARTRRCARLAGWPLGRHGRRRRRGLARRGVREAAPWEQPSAVGLEAPSFFPAPSSFSPPPSSPVAPGQSGAGPVSPWRWYPLRL